MKKLIILSIFLCIAVMAMAQEPMTYSKVIQADSLDKTSIYVALRAWFSETYKSSNAVIQMDDKDAGIIIGKGTTKYSYGGMVYSCYEGYVNYTVKVQIRDGRYKAEVSNINHEVLPGNSKGCILGLITTAEKHSEKGMQKGYDNKVADDIKSKMKEYSEKLFTGMETATNNASKATSVNDEW